MCWSMGARLGGGGGGGGGGGRGVCVWEEDPCIIKNYANYITLYCLFVFKLKNNTKR